MWNCCPSLRIVNPHRENKPLGKQSSDSALSNSKGQQANKTSWQGAAIKPTVFSAGSTTRGQQHIHTYGHTPACTHTPAHAHTRLIQSLGATRKCLHAVKPLLNAYCGKGKENAEATTILLIRNSHFMSWAGHQPHHRRQRSMQLEGTAECVGLPSPVLAGATDCTDSRALSQHPEHPRL